MTIEPSGTPDVVRIRIDANELLCDGGKLLPYPTWIGTIHTVTGKINVWMPAAYTPRGYRSAALRMLEDVASGIRRP
jgi:hypothetical protein